MNILPTCMYVQHFHACCSQRSEEGVRSFETGVKEVVGYQEGAGNQTKGFCEGNSADDLNSLSSPRVVMVCVHDKPWNTVGSWELDSDHQP